MKQYTGGGGGGGSSWTPAADSGSGSAVSTAFTVSGTANEIATSVSGTTVTVGMPNDVTIAGVSTLAGAVKIKRTAIDTASDTTYTVAAADHYIGVDTGTASLTITLQAAATAGAGRVVYVKDESGDAGSGQPITVSGDGSETIDRSASKMISSEYGTLCLISTGVGWAIL